MPLKSIYKIKRTKNPYRITYDESKLVLGRFTINAKNYAVLIDIQDGNRYTEPIEISELEFNSICKKANINDIAEIIDKIINTAFTKLMR